MRILVYGAGVLGGNLASNLYRQGKDVTLLARGKWYEEIKRNGLSIHHYFGGKTNVKIPVINQLKSDDNQQMVIFPDTSILTQERHSLHSGNLE